MKGLKDELLQLDYKAAELIEQLASGLSDGEASKLVESAQGAPEREPDQRQGRLGRGAAADQGRDASTSTRGA